MELPVYVTDDEVRRVCQALAIRDWTVLTEAVVLPEEAGVILAELNAEDLDIPLEEFRRGLEVELEHGKRDGQTNVTNNHPILTGKIALAHLREGLEYYNRLEVAELEGDLLKAIGSGDREKVEALYAELIRAQLDLRKAELDRLGERMEGTQG